MSGDGDGGGNDGRIIGGVIGGIVGFVFLTAIIIFIVVLCKRHRTYIDVYIDRYHAWPTTRYVYKKLLL